MKYYRKLLIMVLILLFVGMPVIVSAAADVRMMRTAPMAQKITPPGVAIEYKQRELNAPPQIVNKLAQLRQQIAAQRLTFEVGYTAAADFPLEQLATLKVPGNLVQQISAQNAIAMQRLKQLPVITMPSCSAGAASFDWRKLGDVTPVKDQGPCGSCWAFGTLGSFEGSWRIINNETIDTAEKDLLDCNTWGYSCGGGWWAFDQVKTAGVAAEAGYPYAPSKAACNAGVARSYKLDTWGYVGTDSNIPSVAAIKQALCAHGPLAIAVRATEAFKHYTNGIFNEHAAGAVNHGVTLVGWDDSKQAWLIKNSWGTGWGSTCDYGSERGYMWISYTSNAVGYAAAWSKAIAAPKPAAEDCVPFNPNTTMVKNINNSWKIVDGNHWMFDFKGNQSAAVRALQIIKFYKMDRSCFVGRPNPSFSYLLVGNSAPAGNMNGQDCIAFNPGAIEVKQIGGTWKIVQGSMYMYDFGAKKEEAVQAMDVIKKYGFTQQCFVARPNAPFQYLHK